MGQTCALLGCWRQGSVTSGGQRATFASAGSSLLSEAEAVTRRRSSQPSGCCRLEPPGMPRWPSLALQPGQLRCWAERGGADKPRLPPHHAVQLATWRARGLGLACLGPDYPRLPTPMGGRTSRFQESPRRLAGPQHLVHTPLLGAHVCQSSAACSYLSTCPWP